MALGIKCTWLGLPFRLLVGLRLHIYIVTEGGGYGYEVSCKQEEVILALFGVLFRTNEAEIAP